MNSIESWKKSIKENRISIVLLSTILIGCISTSLEFSEERVIHWNGKEGDFLSWDFWFQLKYLIGFIFVLALLIKDRTWIDIQMIWCYFACDFIGFLLYKWQGYPEPKALIVSIFFISFSLFLTLNIVWKNKQR